jgi:hypothetical protein
MRPLTDRKVKEGFIFLGAIFGYSKIVKKKINRGVLFKKRANQKIFSSASVIRPFLRGQDLF